MILGRLKCQFAAYKTDNVRVVVLTVLRCMLFSCCSCYKGVAYSLHKIQQVMWCVDSNVSFARTCAEAFFWLFWNYWHCDCLTFLYFSGERGIFETIQVFVITNIFGLIRIIISSRWRCIIVHSSFNYCYSYIVDQMFSDNCLVTSYLFLQFAWPFCY